MIIVLETSITEKERDYVKNYLSSQGFQVREIVGEKETVIGAVGQVSLDQRSVELLPGVARVIPISKPYKLASRELHKEDTVFNVGPVTVGGSRIVIIGGPCSVESREQIMAAAHAVKDAGGVMLRGGAFKPRTSPYSFQGLGYEGLAYLKEAGEATGLPVVTEVVAPADVEGMAEYIDVYQIGARNMQNFELLKKVGSMGMPVILKRGMSATINEWLMAAEYLLASGTDKVILCERGIRTFETYTRNTLDISAIPVVRKLSHLPVIVDPSHGTGIRNKVLPMALAGVAAGANGLIVEIHPNPEEAVSDGPQSLYPEQFLKLVNDVEALAPVVGKEVARLPENHHLSAAVDETVQFSGDSCRVAFQGAHGAYSEKAVKHYFPEDKVESLPRESFPDVFDAVLKGEADWGMIPVENSLAGSILENYDLLNMNPDISIVGEIKIRVRHNLIAHKGVKMEDISEVRSHPQALAQCDRFIKSHGLNPVPAYDTSGAVEDLSKEPDALTRGAIASDEAARVWDMEILKDGIETNPNNYTRFFVIGRKENVKVTKPNKATVMFEISDEAGSLSSCLALFARHSLNMTRIESRPIHGKPWSYSFYIDLDVPEEMADFDKAIEEVDGAVSSFRVLGLYRV
ncbi:MAG: 3-deoxy-7-phosphoheptulonate synthase [Spirochaetales bacterium]|nr:3-deoxy-7-phosphoheptulonate synthase [Spirochaetales bacterium]